VLPLGLRHIWKQEPLKLPGQQSSWTAGVKSMHTAMIKLSCLILCGLVSGLTSRAAAEGCVFFALSMSVVSNAVHVFLLWLHNAFWQPDAIWT